jgi:hypothetical protein
MYGRHARGRLQTIGKGSLWQFVTRLCFISEGYSDELQNWRPVPHNSAGHTVKCRSMEREQLVMLNICHLAITNVIKLDQCKEDTTCKHVNVCR